eukprot:1629523-Karenia_brevis.AAC.1
MDYWSYADWQLLPVAAFDTPAHILTLVEGGSPWPDASLHAKSHPLCKDDMGENKASTLTSLG